MNKKGFITTPILLFLIFGGAAIFLNVRNVKHEIVSSRDNAFIVMAQTYLNASSAWKVTAELNGNNSSCVTLETLRNGYVKDSIIFDGYVDFETKSGPAIYITNGIYTINGKTSDELSLFEDEDLKRSEVHFEIPVDCE